METSHTMVRLSSGSHWDAAADDLLLRMFVSINFLNPHESGLALNCVKLDLTLFCLFLAASRIVNSYRAFTSASVWLLR